jgi:hypothetical protein
MGNNYTKLIGVQGTDGEYQNSQEINSDYAQTITLQFIVGRVGVAGCDFNFAAAANNTQQNLDLGAIIPPQCRIISCTVTCTIAVVGVTDFNASLGSTSAGVDYIAAASCNALNEVVSSGVIPTTIDWSLPNHVFLGGKPTSDTWNLMSAGKWLVTIVYKDYSKI